MKTTVLTYVDKLYRLRDTYDLIWPVARDVTARVADGHLGDRVRVAAEGEFVDGTSVVDPLRDTE